MDSYTEWLEKIKRIYKNADEQVLKFIYDFRNMQKSEQAEEVLYQQFSSGYCYYFAHMLQTAFGRGEVCWAAPYGHIVWVDENGTPYDISGVNDSDTNDFIPEYVMGKTINDFKHVDGICHNTSDQEIAQIVLDWHDVRSERFGGDVTKIKTKEKAKEYLNRAFCVVELEDQMVYDKKREYLKRKFDL